MQNKLNEIREKAIAQINAATNLDALNEVRNTVLGKKGELTLVLRGMKDVAPEDRPKVGQWVNEARDAIESTLESQLKKLEKEALKLRYESEKIDVTMPEEVLTQRSLHPITLVKNELVDIFGSIGFFVYEGP